jgi:hypothetical protein
MTEGADSTAGRLRDAALAARTGRQRPRTARIVVIGEFNSGKTALVNALLGAPVLPAGVGRPTPCPTVLAYSRRQSLAAEMAGRRRISQAWTLLHETPRADTRRLHVGLPLANLQGLRVVDTPGLGLADEPADRRILQDCRGADLVIWCTPAMQAWKHSEQVLWLRLPSSLRRRGVLAVTFADKLQSEHDADRLMRRLRAEAGRYFSEILLMANGPLESPAGGAPGHAMAGPR